VLLGTRSQLKYLQTNTHADSLITTHTHTVSLTHTYTHLRSLVLIEFDDNWVVSVQSVRALWISLSLPLININVCVCVCVCLCVLHRERERVSVMLAFNGRLAALQWSPNVHVIDIWPCTQRTKSTLSPLLSFRPKNHCLSNPPPPLIENVCV